MAFLDCRFLAAATHDQTCPFWATLLSGILVSSGLLVKQRKPLLARPLLIYLFVVDMIS
jgi:hypothetical protein